MMKKVLVLLTAVLMLALAACGGPESGSAGLLTDKEIEELESLYFADMETALKELGFSKKDLDSDSEGHWSLTSAGAYPLKKGRSIGGKIYKQIMLTSVADPEGLYGIRFYALFDDQQEAESAREALLNVAAELYGEPVYSEAPRWRAGEITEFSISFYCAEDAANFDPSWDYRYSLEPEYSIPPVVDGRRLSGDEMAEMVREVQEKREQ